MSGEIKGHENMATTAAIDAALKARSTLKATGKVAADVSKKSAMMAAGKAAGTRAAASKMGAAGVGIVAAMDGYDVYKNLQEDKEFATREDKEGTARLVGNVAVGAGSIWAGAAAGAAIGTAVPIPIVGTVGGFIVGGAAGFATAYFGTQAVDAAVEGTSEYLTGMTDEEALLQSNKKEYMKHWGGEDGKSGLHGQFEQNMEDILRGQQELEELRKSSEQNALIENYRERMDADPAYYKAEIAKIEQRVKDEIAAKEQEINENVERMMHPEHGTYVNYKSFLRGAASEGYISHDKFDESMGHLQGSFKDFAQKSAAIGQVAAFSSVIDYSEMNVNKALANQALGDGVVSKDEISMLQTIMRESGFQAGEYGAAQDGVDGVRGKITNEMLDKAGNGDGIAGYDDVEALIKNANIQLDAAGNYVVGSVTLNKVEFEGMLSDLSIQMNGHQAPEAETQLFAENGEQIKDDAVKGLESIDVQSTIGDSFNPELVTVADNTRVVNPQFDALLGQNDFKKNIEVVNSEDLGADKSFVATVEQVIAADKLAEMARSTSGMKI